VVNTGVLSVISGSLTASGAVTGAGSVDIQGGAAKFLAAFNEDVTFGGASGQLLLARSQAYGGAITGFSLTGSTSLDLRDIKFIGGATSATFIDGGSQTGGQLTVTDGTHVAHIALVGDFTASTFTTRDDGHGGTIVVDPARTASALRLAQAVAGFQGGRDAPHLVHGGAAAPVSAPLVAAVVSGR
jgi:hypothetical protein